MKRYMLTSPAFIAATLLVEGSIITQAELGKKTVQVLGKDGKPTGKTKEVDVRPPSDAIEVDAKGNPINPADEDLLAGLATGDDGSGNSPPPIVSDQGDGDKKDGDKEPDPAAANAPASVDVVAKAEAPKRRGDSK